MGYERKLFIVSEYICSDKPIDNWAEILAMVDVCKCDDLFNVKWENTNATMFNLDGNTQITEDRYEEPIKSAEPEEIVTILEDIYKKSHYLRARTAANLIRDIMLDCNTRDNIKVYSFGY